MKTQHMTVPIEDLRCGGSLQVERTLACMRRKSAFLVSTSTDGWYINPALGYNSPSSP